MTTTVVKDSIVGDAWIQQTAQACPVQYVIGKDGNPTGDLLTGPVRLSFCNLFKLPQVSATNQNPKFGAAIMFTPYANMQLFYDEYYKACAMKFANRRQADGTYAGLHSPFHDQRDKVQFGGFTPGCTYISATSKYKPPIVDSRGNPIVDETKVYAGIWAICAVNAYAYDDPHKKGVAFGLQSVMIIGDDSRFGGGARDPSETFAKVNVSAPIVRPDVAGLMPQGQNTPPPMAAPNVPQQTWTPPAPQQTYAAPPPPPVMSSDDDDLAYLTS